MATIKNFEDLKIWKNATIIAKLVYEDFTSIKDFRFKDQIHRAAVSPWNPRFYELIENLPQIPELLTLLPTARLQDCRTSRLHDLQF